MPLPVIAIVGRPNVGKSTLVNRLAQTAEAIVHEQSGVTRDRSYHHADWNGRDFMLIDTGGIDFSREDAFAPSIREQAASAVEEADVILMMVDGTTGAIADDMQVARILQRSNTAVFLIVNKLDTPGRDDAVHDFWSLGLGQPWAVSSLHGHGTGDLLDAVVAALPPELEEHPEEDGIPIAIIGKPNAGKSSLLNRLAGRERSIVSDVAGTTRDTIDTVVDREGVKYRLLDTAGLRRKGNIDSSVEYYSFVRAMRAMDRADVSLLVVDCESGVTDGDQRVANFALARGCAVVVLLNKWDLVTTEERREELADDITRKLGFVSFAPLVRVSALSGRGMDRVWEAVDLAYGNYRRKITTSALNKLLTELRDFGHTVSKGPKTLRVNYATQTRTAPPGFTFFCNHPRLADDQYRRYLENRMREAFDLEGTPISLNFKSKSD
jgi:ribosome-associated GTPase EngA